MGRVIVGRVIVGRVIGYPFRDLTGPSGIAGDFH